jgi:rod shape-determining protein MreD
MLWDALLGRWLAPPDLTMLIALSVALAAGPRQGALCGALAGALCDLTSPMCDGVTTMTGAVLGLLAGWMGRQIVLDAFWTRWAALASLVFLAAGLRAVIDWRLFGAVLMADWTGPLLASAGWPWLRRRVGLIGISDDEPEPIRRLGAARLIVPRPDAPSGSVEEVLDGRRR